MTPEVSRVKLRRIAAIAAACAMAVGALIGVTGAGTASADPNTPYRLCVHDPNGDYRCAYNYDPGVNAGLQAWAFTESDDPGSLWTYPIDENSGYIESDQFTCLQINAPSDDVRTATCVGDSAEEWYNYYDPNTGRTVFISEYNGDLCLSADYNDNILKADPCIYATEGPSQNWYQEWGSS